MGVARYLAHPESFFWIDVPVIPYSSYFKKARLLFRIFELHVFMSPNVTLVILTALITLQSYQILPFNAQGGRKPFIFAVDLCYSDQFKVQLAGNIKSIKKETVQLILTLYGN